MKMLWRLSKVAELIKVTDMMVYRLAQKKDLPGFKAGGSWRFRRADIDTWAARQIRAARGKGSKQ